MRRRRSVSSKSTQPDSQNNSSVESSQLSSAFRESTPSGAAKPLRDRGPGARKRKRTRMRRRFHGEVTGLERKPLFSGMTLDSVGLNFIASHELGPTGNQAGTFVATPAGPSGGFAAKPYTDPAGNAIIGYGHLLHPGEVDATDLANYPSPIDQATATQLLTQDTVNAVNAVNSEVTVPLTQDQFDGIGRLHL